MTTETPRTDAVSFSSRDPLELMQTSQQLERELNEAKTEVAELNRLMIGWKQRATVSKMDLEASRAEVERLKEQYEAAAEAIARMHEAAVGEIRGPSISVLDDIKAVRERAEKAEAEVERLEAEIERIKAFPPRILQKKPVRKPT